MIDCKTSNNKRYRYIFVTKDIFSHFTWCITWRNKYSQTKTNEFSNKLSTSKRSPVKLERDRGAKIYKRTFVLNSKKIQHYSRFTDKGPSNAERVIRTIVNLLKKPVFLEENANWMSELPSVIKQYNNTMHCSIKMSANQASKKSNEKIVLSNF